MPPTVFPTGVTTHQPDLAHGTFVLFDGRDSNSYLVDMNGNVAMHWSYKGFPSEIIDPALVHGERGRIFVQGEDPLFENETLLELDWLGNVVWQWGGNAPESKAGQAWDQARLPNGNTLVLSILTHTVPEIASEPIRDQAIVEVTPDGKIVWRWIASAHIDELGFAGERRTFLVNKGMPRRPTLLEINNMSPLGPNRWYEAGDTRFHPDNIIIDSRCGNVIAIIDRKTDAIVWRIGPDFPGSYDYARKYFAGPVPRPIDAISGQHDAHLIPMGLPGAGNLLLFDNQGAAGVPPAYSEFFSGSRVLEINPETTEIVWQYDASCDGRDFWTFHSCFVGSARRLPNGNTLICEGMYGRIFQVTPKGKTVWEYISPHFGTYSTHGVPTGSVKSNWIFRAQPVPYDWVPSNTMRGAYPVSAPDIATFRIPVLRENAV